MKKTIIQYKDVLGRERFMTLLESDVRMVKWHKTEQESLVSVYKLDDGSIVHIPENVWTVFGIGRIIREIEDNE